MEPADPGRCREVMKLRIWFTTCAAAALLLIIGPSHAAAGGWAITALDPFEQPTAGEPTVIGFTILQHGVTPAEVDDAGIRIVGGQFFPAIRDGVGHYTANVVFPTAGTFSWVVEQGWFGPQELGQITIGGAATQAVAAGSSWQYPAALRLGLPLIAALCLVIIVGQSALERRRAALR
jgi:hypothetical protein